VLLQIGRCYLALHETTAAEESFLAAIDADEMSIEPRIELANMYERAKEGEEALILAAEAMAICEAQDQETETGESINRGQKLDTSERATALRRARMEAAVLGKQRARKAMPTKPVIPRRYRAKRLVDPVKRRQDEQAHAIKLAQQYENVTDLKRRIAAGHTDLIATWMVSSRELIDDFRSLKRFYTWDKYLQFLGPRTDPGEPSQGNSGTDLARLYQRLARSTSRSDTLIRVSHHTDAFQQLRHRMNVLVVQAPTYF
jgi:general transcription factor 3C polypeptide 3 (transcription factor C subunit 4)